MRNKIKHFVALLLLATISQNSESAVGLQLTANQSVATGETWEAVVADSLVLRNFDVVGRIDRRQSLQANRQSDTDWWVDLMDAAGNRLSRIAVGSQMSLSNFNDSKDIEVTATSPTVEPIRMTIAGETSSNNRQVAISIVFSEGNRAEIRAGIEDIDLLGELTLTGNVGKIAIGGNTTTEIVTANWKCTPDIVRRLQTDYTEATLAERFAASTDEREGFYDYVDGSYDVNKGKKGGNYRIALVADGSGGYDMIYVSGATANVSAWQVGMKKGKLSPTTFVNNYNLLWYDAELSESADEQWASLTPPLLDLNFPLNASSMRFARSPRR